MNDQIDNDLKLSLPQALELIKTREGKNFSTGKVNLAELQKILEFRNKFFKKR